MKRYEPQTSRFAERVRESFAQQALMKTIGASILAVHPGEVLIELPFRDDLTQQHGYLHAGVVTSIVDSACGYAALSLMPEDANVLSVEYKINLLSPAQGARFLARGRVKRAGRNLTICEGEVTAFTGDEEKTVALMLATMMMIRERG